MSRFLKTLRFRLTFWYTAISFGLSVLGLIAVYIVLASNMRHRSHAGATVELRELDSIYEERGLDGLKDDYAHDVLIGASDVLFVRITSVTGGDLLLMESAKHNAAPVNPYLVAPIAVGKTAFEPMPMRNANRRMLVSYLKLPRGIVIQVGTAMRADDTVLNDYRWTAMLILGVLLLVSATGGSVLAGRAMAAVQSVSVAAMILGRGDLARRVAVGPQGEEIDNLAAAFNTMAARIENLVTELRQVTNDVAHDLRSPLTRIRAATESALMDRDATERERELAAVVIEECDRLIAVINTMLEIAETESGVKPLAKEPVDVAELARDAHELFQPMASDKRIHFELSVSGAGLTVSGDRTRLQRMLANLVDNAIKYTPPGGEIRVSVVADGADARISVADNGDGIDLRDLLHVFDRFYRGDRSRSTPGNGLGLSLARAVARAHGGDIAVSSQPRKGSTFAIVLPLA